MDKKVSVPQGTGEIPPIFFVVFRQPISPVIGDDQMPALRAEYDVEMHA
jgi:hypothetical protein